MRTRLAAVLALTVAGCGDSPSTPEPTGCAGSYPDESSSAYVLPWSVGKSFRIGQGNCGPGSHAAGTMVQYAYDVLMPVGEIIVAARGGRVLLVEERFTDGNRTPGEENFINIVHDDGTIAGYVHLTHDGALVEPGETVAQGQLIGLSGDTGSSSEPHLHFHVQGCDGCATIPVTFRNTRPHPRGLVAGETYEALE